jgi:exodeoxyribonuclease X
MSEATEQFCVVDTETTGTGAGDTPVEVALVRLRDGAKFSSLVNPGRPIPPESSAVHGITDEDIEGAAAPHLAELEDELLAFVGDSMLVAHNAEFDRGMLPMFDRHRWLCTMRLSKHAWPDAPNFKNATLRYWRKLKIDAPDGLQMHRALYDAIVTAALFADLRMECERLFGAVSGSQLLELARRPALVRAMPFGKHFGEPIDHIPSGYLNWLLEKCDNVDEDLRYTVKQALLVNH